MRKILPAFLIFTVSLLVLLPIAYLIILWSFQGSVSLNTPKFLEESAKVMVSFFLALLAFGLSQITEILKINRKVNAQQNLLDTFLTTERIRVKALYSIPVPDPVTQPFEDLRINTEFYVRISDQVEEIRRSIAERQSLLTRVEPEVLSHFQEHVGLFSEILSAIELYSKKPSRDNLTRFRQSLDRLLHFSNPKSSRSSHHEKETQRSVRLVSESSTPAKPNG